MTAFRSTLLAGITAALCLMAQTATGAERAKYDAAAFAAAAKAGKSILVDVTAPWCPTCKAQHPIIEEITSGPEHKDTVVFDVDFDTQKDALKTFKVTLQSTLIAFKGETETGRSVAATTREPIAALLKSAL